MKYGIANNSDKDIDTVYTCDTCNKPMTITEIRKTPEHRIPGWIIHEGWAYILKCLDCQEKEQ